jgi:hypothetical protein
VYNIKSKCPKIDPCGTPDEINAGEKTPHNQNVLSGIVLPELQRFYGRAIVIITPVGMPISDINRPLSIIIFVLYLSVYRVVLGRIYD